MSGVLFKVGVAHRDQVRAQERRIQAEWLAQAGLDRALFRLAASAGYTGETWQIAAADLGLAEPADRDDGPPRGPDQGRAGRRHGPNEADQGPGRLSPRSPAQGPAFPSTSSRARFAQDRSFAMIQKPPVSQTRRAGRIGRRVPPATPGGFTLIELLVVIAIISVLVALLLPGRAVGPRGGPAVAVRQQPDAARARPAELRIGPRGPAPGRGQSEGPGPRPAQGLRLRLDHPDPPLTSSRRTSTTTSTSRSALRAPRTRPRGRTWCSSFLCPSDAGPTRDKNRIAMTSYAGVHHDVEAPIAADNHGVLFLNSAVRYEDITDGSSNTLFVGEKLNDGLDLGWASGTRASLRNTGPEREPDARRGRQEDPSRA